MTHPLDEAIAEARRMAANAAFLARSPQIGGLMSGEAIRLEHQTLEAKWTRIEKALVEAKEKLVCECGKERIGYCLICDNDE